MKQKINHQLFVQTFKNSDTSTHYCGGKIKLKTGKYSKPIPHTAHRQPQVQSRSDSVTLLEKLRTILKSEGLAPSQDVVNP